MATNTASEQHHKIIHVKDLVCKICSLKYLEHIGITDIIIPLYGIELCLYCKAYDKDISSKLAAIPESTQKIDNKECWFKALLTYRVCKCRDCFCHFDKDMHPQRHMYWYYVYSPNPKLVLCNGCFENHYGASIVDIVKN